MLPVPGLPVVCVADLKPLSVSQSLPLPSLYSYCSAFEQIQSSLPEPAKHKPAVVCVFEACRLVLGSSIQFCPEQLFVLSGLFQLG